MARERGAVLAVNGGYFVMHRKDGLQGVPAGIGVYDGRLESLATNGRAALLLGAGILLLLLPAGDTDPVRRRNRRTAGFLFLFAGAVFAALAAGAVDGLLP